MFNKDITQLPVSFVGKGEVRGFKFTQIGNSGKAYIYRVDTGYNLYFEVFIKKLDTRFNKEFYPKSKYWGSSAWTFKDQEKAFRKLQELNG